MWVWQSPQVTTGSALRSGSEEGRPRIRPSSFRLPQLTSNWPGPPISLESCGPRPPETKVKTREGQEAELLSVCVITSDHHCHGVHVCVPEMRLKEMVSMGVGNKPFLDIQPSDAAISDRAVHYIMKSRGDAEKTQTNWLAISYFNNQSVWLCPKSLTTQYIGTTPLCSAVVLRGACDEFLVSFLVWCKLKTPFYLLVMIWSILTGKFLLIDRVQVPEREHPLLSLSSTTQTLSNEGRWPLTPCHHQARLHPACWGRSTCTCTGTHIHTHTHTHLYIHTYTVY